MRAPRTLTALLVILASLLVIASPAQASPAQADRWCDTSSDPNRDQRSPAQKLPKQGVIEIQRFQFSEPSYSARTIEEDGSKGFISLNDHDSTVPLVSAWETPAKCFGSAGSIRTGGWAVTPFGRVYTDGGEAGHYGDMNGKRLNQPVVGMAPTPTGLGYWLVASDGGMFTFGDARFLGSTGDIRLNQPIVAMAATPTGNGYWLAAADGGLFSFGDAAFFGSTGGTRLNRPMVGMVPTPTGRGYWMVARDGGIFTFGDAVFKGSTGNQNLTRPIVGMVPNGTGYTLVDEAGTIYPFQ